MKLVLLIIALSLLACTDHTPAAAVCDPHVACTALYHDPAFDAYCAANPGKGTCP